MDLLLFAFCNIPIVWWQSAEHIVYHWSKLWSSKVEPYLHTLLVTTLCGIWNKSLEGRDEIIQTLELENLSALERITEKFFISTCLCGQRFIPCFRQYFLRAVMPKPSSFAASSILRSVYILCSFCDKNVSVRRIQLRYLTCFEIITFIIQNRTVHWSC